MRKQRNIPSLRFPEFDGEWEDKKLGDIAKVKRGASPRPIADKKWFDETSTVGWVRISDVTRSNKILNVTEQHLSEAGIKKSRFIPKGNLIMSICATIGKPIYTGFDVCIHDGFVVFDKLSTKKDFMYYLLDGIQRRWVKYGQPGIQLNLNSDIVSSEKVALPIEQSEQQKIADFLTAVDKRIAQLEEKKRLLTEYKKGVMQQIFSQQIRFTDDNGNPYPDWEEKRLGDVCGMQAGKFVRAANINEYKKPDLYPCFGGNGVRGFTKTFTHDGKHSLIGRQGALCGNINLATGKFHATEHAIVTTPKEGTSVDWLFYKLIHLNLNQYATGQAQPGLSVNNLEKIVVDIPRIEKEQQKIADFLTSIDNKIEQVGAQLEQAKAFKKGLLQQMFV